jgi:hypothetical protein
MIFILELPLAFACCTAGSFLANLSTTMKGLGDIFFDLARFRKYQSQSTCSCIV